MLSAPVLDTGSDVAADRRSHGPDGHTGYTAPGGIPALREAIAAHVSATRRIDDVTPAQVVVCPGSKPPIFGDPRGVEAMVETLRARRDALVDGLSTLPGIRCDRPEGASFAFADVRGTGLSSRVLADRFLEEAGVACVEGTAFGPAGEGFLRFSFVDDVARIREATSRMRNLLGG